MRQYVPMNIAIIGAGAAGCFCAAELRRRLPEARIDIFEAQAKAMAKLAITGGGRCNLTNSFAQIRSLSEAYPRGERLVKAAFRNLSPSQTVTWWEDAGVGLTLQEDQCYFPKSQSALQVVHTLEALIRGCSLHLKTKITSIRKDGEHFSLLSANSKESFSADIVVLCSGGGALSMLSGLPGIEIQSPVPSLFSFRIHEPKLCALMGTTVLNAKLKLAGTKYEASGTLLVTDWGLSGPAVLKLSSYVARELAEKGYKARLLVNYLSLTQEELLSQIASHKAAFAQKLLLNMPLKGFSSRLWAYLVEKAGIRADMRWAELGSKGAGRLASILGADEYQIEGRCRFKEEFVTAGGVACSQLHTGTLECKAYPGLYFAGEVLDIDAITGGFNLQAAWSTAFTVAKSIEEKFL